MSDERDGLADFDVRIAVTALAWAVAALGEVVEAEIVGDADSNPKWREFEEALGAMSDGVKALLGREPPKEGE